MGEENMKEKLVAALKSIQWTYAIFWSPSPQLSGVLEWGDGYYNGGIKTRKTIQTLDINANDQTVSQRSDQLRELYLSLFADDDDNDDRYHRPLAALSPEDLTNAEWFYLVSMSYVFHTSQGLPGRSLVSGKTIWLPNSHCVDTNVFPRALLAKSAGIKTVACFPFMAGVIELGVTDLVEEDLNLIQQIRSFLEESPLLHHPAFSPPVQSQNVELISSLGSSSCGAELGQSLVDMYLFEGLSNLEDHTIMNNEDHLCGFSNRDQISENLHYQNVLSSLFKETDEGFLQQESLNKKSGFIRWKKGANDEKVVLSSEVKPQRLLKKILFEVPWMHNAHSMKCNEERVQKGVFRKQEVLNMNHVLAERRRREKVSERFSTLRSLIPTRSKADKVSILDDTITYLKELERRVEELESCQELTSFDAKTKKKRKPAEKQDRTSNSYDETEIKSSNTIDSLIENTITITISMVNKDIMMNISCPWRENMLLQIIDAMTNLHLHSQSIHSSTIDGILSLNIQFKVKGSITSESVEAITQTLLEVIRSG